MYVLQQNESFTMELQALQSVLPEPAYRVVLEAPLQALVRESYTSIVDIGICPSKIEGSARCCKQAEKAGSSGTQTTFC
jgi:hypothetical protein